MKNNREIQLKLNNRKVESNEVVLALFITHMNIEFALKFKIKIKNPNEKFIFAQIPYAGLYRYYDDVDR